MKSVLEKILVLIFLLVLISCQNDLIENNKESEVESELEVFPIHVVYNGQDYYSQCQLVNDSLIIEDEVLKNIIDELFLKNDNVQTYVHDGVIEYFDNRESFENKYHILEYSNSDVNIGIITRSDEESMKAADGYAIVWEDKDYKGWNMKFWEYKDGHSTMDHWNISKPDNDKISSLEVHLNTLGLYTHLYCYEDNNYEGACLIVSASIPDNNWTYHGNCIPNLKKIPRGRKNWGDAISSLRLTITDYPIGGV